MEIKTGRQPVVKHLHLPTMSSVAVEIMGTPFLEPLSNLQPMDVWVVHFAEQYVEKVDSDFMLFTSEPDVKRMHYKYATVYTRSLSTLQDQDSMLKAQQGIPADALLQVDYHKGQMMMDRMFTWWEVTL